MWEQEYGIKRDVTLNQEERRARVLAKIRAKTTMNPYKLQEIIRSETGVSAHVVENTGKNTFAVRLMANSQSELRHGLQIQNLINRHKPAHLICEVDFQMVTLDAFYAGGIIRSVKKMTIKQG